MRQLGGFLATAFLFLFAACGGSGPGSTPEDTFAAFQSAVQSEDYDEIVDLIPPKAKEQLKEAFDEAKKHLDGPEAEAGMKNLNLTKEEVLDCDTPEEFAALMIRKMAEKDPDTMEKIATAEVKDSKVNGNTATLTIESGDYKSTIRFTQDENLWYIEMNTVMR